MKRLYYILAIMFLLITASAFVKIDSEKADVVYPEGYRKWTHIKSAIIGPKNPAYTHFGGIHHIYANDQAMIGYSTGKFPEGSIIVFDVLEVSENNTDINEGKRRIIDVMEKDSKRFADTGGWGFDEFDGDSKTIHNVKDQAAAVECYNCHAKRKSTDAVFSTYRL